MTAARSGSSTTATSALSDAVTGSWQLLAAALGGLWWIGLGVLLRARWRWFSRFSLLLGAVAVATVVGRAFGLDYESSAPASPAFLPIAVWPAWLGVLLWTGR
ncbi:MAG: hypothetical protein ACR2NA_01935 [Solirubrobacterales bacterium]